MKYLLGILITTFTISTAQPAQAAIKTLIQNGMTESACNYTIRQLERQHIIFTRGWVVTDVTRNTGICHATYLDK